MTQKSITKNITKLLDAKEDIKREKAQDAGKLGYIGRVMVMTSLPHTKSDQVVFSRSSGKHTLHITAPRGLPYGIYPRLLLAWITRKAVLFRTSAVYLPVGVSAFMRELGIENAGGSDKARMREQAKRLFSCAISMESTTKNYDEIKNFPLVEEAVTWWTTAEEMGDHVSGVILSDKFYKEIMGL